MAQPPQPAAPPDLQAQRQKFFESRRADLQRQATGQQQEASDAIQRRFASIGQSASGAAIAAGQKAREGINAQALQAQNDLAGQELQAQFQEAQLAEPGLQRQFQSAEGEKARQFQSAEAGKIRQFEGDFRNKAFDFEKETKLRQLDMADRQMQQDSAATAFNAFMASLQSGVGLETIQDRLRTYIQMLERK